MRLDNVQPRAYYNETPTDCEMEVDFDEQGFLTLTFTGPFWSQPFFVKFTRAQAKALAEQLREYVKD